MGNPETGPLAQAVEAMLVGLALLRTEHRGEGEGGTPGALIVRAAAVTIAEAADVVEVGERRKFAESVIDEAFTIAKGRDRSREHFLSDRVLDDVKQHLQVAVDALVGVHPYA